MDSPNLFHCGEHEGCRIDYVNKFVPFLLKGRTLIDTFYINSKGSSPGERAFLRKVATGGYKMKLFPHRNTGGRLEEKRVDTQLVADAIVNGFNDRYDTAVICS